MYFIFDLQTMHLIHGWLRLLTFTGPKKYFVHFDFAICEISDIFYRTNYIFPGAFCIDY